MLRFAASIVTLVVLSVSTAADAQIATMSGAITMIAPSSTTAAPPVMPHNVAPSDLPFIEEDPPRIIDTIVTPITDAFSGIGTSLRSMAIEALVEQLGSPNYGEREVAQAALYRIGPAALEFLYEAILESTDLEIVRRAKILVAQIENTGYAGVIRASVSSAAVTVEQETGTPALASAPVTFTITLESDVPGLIATLAEASVDSTIEWKSFVDGSESVGSVPVKYQAAGNNTVTATVDGLWMKAADPGVSGQSFHLVFNFVPLKQTIAGVTSSVRATFDIETAQVIVTVEPAN